MLDHFSHSELACPTTGKVRLAAGFGEAIEGVCAVLGSSWSGFLTGIQYRLEESIQETARQIIHRWVLAGPGAANI